MNHSHISIPSPRLLLVEDDPRLREDLDAHFRRRGFRVTVCGDGSHGLEAAGREAFDLVLLDIMLPGLDGLALLESLRREQATPVMLMSALGAEQDRISGFTRGADDYLPKPFSLAELDARTDALLRRVRLDRLPSAQRRDTRLVFDDQAQDVLHQGLPAGLTPSEYRLLATLREHAGEALSKPFLPERAAPQLHAPRPRSRRARLQPAAQTRRGRRPSPADPGGTRPGLPTGGDGTPLMRRHPLLWKLALLQVGFCLLLTWLIYTWGLSVERSTYFLAPADRSYLADYARQAEDAWRSEGAAGAERFRKELSAKEDTWVALVGPHLESLGSTPLSAEESSHLTFMRKLDWPMSRRLQDELPYVSIEFPGHPEQGRLVIQLPERLLPGGLTPWTHLVTHGIVPTLLAALLGLLLYRHLVVPLNRLRDRADALRADELESTPLAAPLAARRDELGELAQALEHMAERLRLSLAQQRLLLRTLSHELRTPLARLRIAHDSELPPEQLRQRLDREIGDMQRLLEDTLDLAWMDTERPQLPTEPVLALSVWEALRDDACFESGWDPARLPCRLGVDCRVEVHLDSLAQAMENLLRNAIRHSPEDGTVSLDGEREGDFWHLRLQDQGPGVAEDQLERIFLPYQRLDDSAGEGFGLGLAIARRAIELQGGRLWASNGKPGLCLHLWLPAAA